MEDVVLYSKIEPKEYNFLRQSVGWYLPEEEQTKLSLENSIYVVKADIGGETVGMARLVGDGVFYFLLVDVIVLPEYQGRGIGTLMVREILKFANKKRKVGQTFSVQLSSAKGREGFYERFGFEKRPNDHTGCGMGLLLKD